jgi:hypothetical protein
MTPQIKKLADMTEALRTGTATYFSITRLTSLKGLCKDPAVAALFVFHLANCVHRKVRAAPPPRYTKAADWKRYRTVIAKAVPLMRKYLKDPNAATREPLFDMRVQAQAVQEYTGLQVWGRTVRSIHSVEVLVIEDALNAILQPAASSFWAYDTARAYAERYDTRYGTGLVPDSVPALEDILRFWLKHEPPVPPAKAMLNPPGRSRPGPRTKAATPTPPAVEQSAETFEQVYPRTAEWIQSHGWIEVGQNDVQRSLVRALDEGGLVWEGKTRYASMDALWRDLERGLADWFAVNGG